MISHTKCYVYPYVTISNALQFQVRRNSKGFSFILFWIIFRKFYAVASPVAYEDVPEVLLASIDGLDFYVLNSITSFLYFVLLTD